MSRKTRRERPWAGIKHEYMRRRVLVLAETDLLNRGARKWKSHMYTKSQSVQVHTQVPARKHRS